MAIMKNQSEWNGKKHRIQFGRMQRAMILFGIIVAILIAERHNISYEKSDRILSILDNSVFNEKMEDKAAESLLIWNSSQDNSTDAHAEMVAVLNEMKIRADEADMAGDAKLQLEGYNNLIIALDSLDVLGDELFTVLKFIREGGNLLMLYLPDSDTSFGLVSDKLGILEFDADMYTVEGLRFKTEFMIGGKSKDYLINDPFDSAAMVMLDPDCKVYLTSADEKEIALLWKYAFGKGNVVVSNLNYFEKVYRGFYAAAFSLLEDVCVYPVINGSAFYLDDFPSPVPGGEGEYIMRDYGINIEDFYTNIWWPDIRQMASKYGIRYTGLVIDNYSDENEAPFEGNKDVARYHYFGNKLLDDGGEIGFHGYNHMPLVLDNFDYKGQFDSYKQWKSPEDMRLSVAELDQFCHTIFPKEEFQVYVPPSNILSEEGRQMLITEFPEIKAIASIYFPGEFEYTQDFKVSDDEMIETPRIISGYIIDPYMEIAALSELNYHYVNSHFQHPDDVLDVDRGAQMGWEKLKNRLGEYIKWLYDAAPEIRNLTGSEMASAVQRYYYIDTKLVKSESEIKISLSNFQDEAWLFVRINEGSPGEVSGGTLTEVADSLYLLEAQESEIMIQLENEVETAYVEK